MTLRKSYRKVVGWIVLVAFFSFLLAGFVPSAVAGGGSGDPVKPVPVNPGGTSYKAPSSWNFLVLYLKYLKFHWGLVAF